MLTQEYLKSILNYDKDTGLFMWLVKKAQRTKVGDIAGSAHRGYVCIIINGQWHLAHRLAWLYMYGKFPENFIDHKNGVRNDNRIANLRDVTRGGNNQNSRKARSDNASGFLGVSYHKRTKKYQAEIQVNCIQKYIGLYETPELAHDAYLTAKRLYHSTCTI